jgi:uronate dehydrogenase
MAKKLVKRLLVTGAAGGIGRALRQKLIPVADILRLSDREGLGEAAAHEEIVYCDLMDKQAVEDLAKECDGIIHLGGQSVEADWDTVRDSNIDGLFNLYEAARKNKVGRILFASSNHVIGYYPQSQLLDATTPPRPDGLYGVSKAFGEALASLYHDKFGIETAIVRIGSCFPEPANHRMLATWLSADDLTSLIQCMFEVPRLGCPIIYGMSDNDVVWWDNRHVAYLGWKPKHNSAIFKEKLDRELERPDKEEAVAVYQGGVYTQDPIMQPKAKK